MSPTPSYWYLPDGQYAASPPVSVTPWAMVLHGRTINVLSSRSVRCCTPALTVPPPGVHHLGGKDVGVVEELVRVERQHAGERPFKVDAAARSLPDRPVVRRTRPQRMRVGELLHLPAVLPPGPAAGRRRGGILPPGPRSPAPASGACRRHLPAEPRPPPEARTGPERQGRWDALR